MKLTKIFLVCALFSLTGCSLISGDKETSQSSVNTSNPSVTTSSTGGHVHTFSNEWSYNSQQHWRAATCEHTDLKNSLEGHKFGEWKYSVAPTETEEGTKYRVCSVCDYIEHAVAHPTGTVSKLKFTISNDGKYYSVEALNKDISGAIVIPDYYEDLPVKKVVTGGFSHCTEVTSIYIGDNITSFGDYNFGNMTKLLTARIGNGITSSLSFIDHRNDYPFVGGSFHNCPSLVSFEVDSKNTGLSVINGALYTKDQKRLILVPAATNLTFTVPSTVNIIGPAAFAYTNISNVTIPTSVTEVGNYGFAYCTKLEAVTLPHSVTKIGSCAFECCEKITEFVMPDSVTQYGNQIFNCCGSLTSLTLSNQVDTLTPALMQGTKIETFEVPLFIKHINGCPFSENTMTIIIHAGIETIANNAFDLIHPTNIQFLGTRDQWKALFHWDGYNHDADDVVHCSDGDVTFQETVEVS